MLTSHPSLFELFDVFYTISSSYSHDIFNIGVDDVLWIDIDKDGEPTPYGPFKSVSSCVGAGRVCIIIIVFIFCCIVSTRLIKPNFERKQSYINIVPYVCVQFKFDANSRVSYLIGKSVV